VGYPQAVNFAVYDFVSLLNKALFVKYQCDNFQGFITDIFDAVTLIRLGNAGITQINITQP
jgi:hypothetical protein